MTTLAEIIRAAASKTEANRSPIEAVALAAWHAGQERGRGDFARAMGDKIKEARSEARNLRYHSQAESVIPSNAASENDDSEEMLGWTFDV